MSAPSSSRAMLCMGHAFARLCPMLRMGRPGPAFPPRRAPTLPHSHERVGRAPLARLWHAPCLHFHLAARRNAPGKPHSVAVRSQVRSG